MKKWAFLVGIFSLVLFSSDGNASTLVAKPQVFTVAVIDTGVDLAHPDFKGRLVKGMNLLNYKEQPQDDNGHGTQVTGVVLSTFDTYLKNFDIRTQVKVMPIKALSANGEGSENKLAEGIRYATEQNVDVILLALGMYDDNPSLRKAVIDAEKAGIFVTAATGNEGETVKYPAAYDTVLGVGGLDYDLQVPDLSNFGDEVDVVASWNMFTTALGGTYEFSDGTSMAAPQAAAAAVLYLSLNPQAKPLEIRQHIIQTADDIESPGWDRKSGYGNLRIDKLLSQPLKVDMYESNNTREEAAPLPLESLILVQMNGNTDRDWFQLQTQYKGKVEFRLSPEHSTLSTLQFNLYPANEGKSTSYTLTLGKPLVLSLPKGKNLIELSLPGKDKRSYKYAFSNRFYIYEDDFEDNDRQYKAFVLPARNQQVTGTFAHENDEDWFMFQLEKKGTLSLQVTARNARMDVVLRLQKRNERLLTIDRNEYGKSEVLPLMEVDAGKYFVSISNADGTAVNGEYDLLIQYAAQTAGSEPNDEFYQASKIKFDQPYSGVLNNSNEVDYYQFTISGESLIRLDLKLRSLDPSFKVLLLDNKGNLLRWSLSGRKGERMQYLRALERGTYFIKMLNLSNQLEKSYQMNVARESLVNGFLDISQHWARPAIVSLSKQKILTGDGDFQFYPNRAITRAEAVAMTARAFQWNQLGKIRFKDVKNTDWAYDEIAKAVRAGIINGYPDDTFRPDQPITRAEMSILLANALELKRLFILFKPFDDVPVDYWATNAITQLKSKDIVNGFANGYFYPESVTTRAEFATALQAALNERPQ